MPALRPDETLPDERETLLAPDSVKLTGSYDIAITHPDPRQINHRSRSLRFRAFSEILAFTGESSRQTQAAESNLSESELHG